MPGVLLNDVSCRLTHIQAQLKMLQEKINDNSTLFESIARQIERGHALVKELQDIENRTKELIVKSSDDDHDQLNACLEDYVTTLTGDGPRKCQTFIEVCELLLYYTQQADFEKYFGSLNRNMNECETVLGTNKQFQPKIIDIFQSLEKDLGQHIIPSIPCRVGFIGQISVGKSSLSNALRHTDVDYLKNSQTEIIAQKKLSSPIRVGKSTFCRMEFEHEYEDGKKVIFVDIEGSTDSESNLKSGNYFDEIKKADCDLYIIVFNNQFTDVHHEWQRYIVNILERKCILVRSNTDDLFLRTYEESVGQSFDLTDNERKEKYAKNVIEQIRKIASFDIKGQELSDVYLTSVCNKSSLKKYLATIPCLNFDFEKLEGYIRILPLTLHKSRLQKMAVSAMARVINICFRRGYVMNIFKYNIAAGVAAFLPFLDLIPRYLGRENIRQAFGVNTRSRLMNWWKGTTDEFKVYLSKFKITLDEAGFKTSAFKETFHIKKTDIRNSAVSVSSSTITKGVTSVGVVGIALSDDVLRLAGIGAINAIRGLSISLIVVGGVLTAGMCVWSAVSNGKQMYSYLNRLCDDLIIVSQHVALKILDDNNEIREYFSN
ncbi:unnamed protein product [Rotaria sp. Silwood1]|nr:unnamed protein product [Rotaria sp. Silwood1]CAF1619963.1 unnamed protein product [Rotaria sp. Silwood1]CAF1620138.1 unnamed protein product [Rotaria sp. Silwood1]CAF3744246.1 unnamed protein product [Rotaria sp. Silwood1]CAF3854375.1 unnamed protein product [Rotaria sp. Silwood1]